MGAHDMHRAKELKWLRLSREQVAQRALVICKQATEDGSYINAVAAIGRMHMLSNAIDDGYWKEKRDMGKSQEYQDLIDQKMSIEDIKATL